MKNIGSVLKEQSEKNGWDNNKKLALLVEYLMSRDIVISDFEKFLIDKAIIEKSVSESSSDSIESRLRSARSSQFNDGGQSFYDK